MDSVIPAGRPAQRTEYDILNRVIKSWDGVNANPIVNHYGPLQLDSVTDPSNQTYRYSYNVLGWATGFTNPFGRSTSSQYDRNGRLVSWTNRRGQTISYGYDDLGRLLSKTGSSVENLSFQYSPDGREVTGVSPQVTETTYLNVRGQPDSVRTYPSTGGTTLRQIFGYTPEGRLDTVGITSSAPGVTFQTRRFGYNDSLGTLDSLWFGNALTYMRRQLDGQLLSIQLPTGAWLYPGFSEAHGLTSISSNAPFNSTIGRHVGRDSLGNIVQQTDYNSATGQNYVYDDLNRLREVQDIAPSECFEDPTFGWICNPGPPTTVAIFDYDSVGNRYVLPSDTFAVGHRIRRFNGCYYSNDYDGNITSRTCGSDVRLYTYYGDSKLKSVTVNGVAANYYYDSQGRLARITSAGPSGRYYWLGDNLLTQLNWNATVQRAEFSFYGTDNLHAVRKGGVNYYAHADGAGNVIALTDESDNLARTYEYDPWGIQTGGNDIAGLGNKDYFRFKGALNDPGFSGLYYMRNRWYEPESGRFLTEDPIGLAGGINPYAFANSNPMTFSDPAGLSPCCRTIYVWGNRQPYEPNVVDSRYRRITPLEAAMRMAQNYDGRYFNYDWWDCDPAGASDYSCGEEQDREFRNSLPTDACDVYQGEQKGVLGWFAAAGVRHICKAVSAPDGVNSATAECLARTWRGGMGARGIWNYLWYDHRVCYEATGYSKLRFGWDYARRAGWWEREDYWKSLTPPFLER